MPSANQRIYAYVCVSFYTSVSSPSIAQEQVAELRPDMNELAAEREPIAAAVPEPIAIDRAELAELVNATRSRSHDTNVMMSVMTIAIRM